MIIRVGMFPDFQLAQRGVGGINTLIQAYYKHLPDYDIVLDNDDFDLMAIHAGAATKYVYPMVSHLHGLYWTADYPNVDQWQLKSNSYVIDSIRHAQAITVPSEWVAKTIRRDVRVNPTVIGHGIDIHEWEPEPTENYVLWNKNRARDVCSPQSVAELAVRFPEQQFISTFAPQHSPRNIQITGTMPYPRMKDMVKKSLVYLSSTKETFGIGILEAMASGVPILGFAEGGILETVQHGVNGYLAQPNNYDDLANGLDYCIKHRITLGNNGRELAKLFTWSKACEKVANVYKKTLSEQMDPSVSVVIPVFNKSETLERAVKSVLSQTRTVEEIIIVDNNSSDNSLEVARDLAQTYENVSLHNESKQGVAHARNHGMNLADGKYICCLDADDEIEPLFIEACVDELENDPSLGIAYTKLKWVDDKSGKSSTSEWPNRYDFDQFIHKKNQVPTCCVFRKEVFTRLGGMRQRYAPDGAGAEDAEFWLRAGAYGWRGKLVTEAPLFVYHLGGATSSKNYKEVDWLQYHPWVYDAKHPFVSMAKPRNFSHAVRQYDQPLISVIIPVGPNHTDIVFNALDSLEAQSLRKWEVIVVTDNCSLPQWIIDAYPYVEILSNENKSGAGGARNFGVKIAKADLIFFLDADDVLTPTALDDMINLYSSTGGIIYSDYYGKAIVDDVSKLDKKLQQKIVNLNPKNNEATILYTALPFERERIFPLQNPPYLWCNVSCLIPKSYHTEIGGFNEDLQSWEDVDYFYRMAHSCKCFYKVEKPLLIYKFYSGSRRNDGMDLYPDLLNYMKKEYNKDMAGCSGCGGGSKIVRNVVIPMNDSTQQSMDNNVIKIVFNSSKQQSQAVVVDPATGTRRYARPGDVFYVHKEIYEKHKSAHPQANYWLSPVVDRPSVQVEKKPVPTPEPVSSSESLPEVPRRISKQEFLEVVGDGLYDFQQLPGVSPAVAAEIENLGIKTLQDLMDNQEKLGRIKGIGSARRDMILDRVAELLIDS